MALVREVPDSFEQALVSERQESLDVRVARSQHAAYVRHLEEAGHEVVVIPADTAHPDCVFVEDTAVILGGVGVITRPGAPTRRGEVDAVAQTLGRWFPLVFIEAPGTVDGGDVIVGAGEILVGRSKRTNSEGIASLSSIASEAGLGIREVGIHEGLHLKSAVLPIDGETMVVTRGAVDETALDGFRVLYEDERERFRFSALPTVDGRVLVTANAPRTVETVERLGFDAVPIEMSSIQAADGGLTCMSILFDTK